MIIGHIIFSVSYGTCMCLRISSVGFPPKAVNRAKVGASRKSLTLPWAKTKKKNEIKELFVSRETAAILQGRYL